MIKDYLHLYLGCEIKRDGLALPVTLTIEHLDYISSLGIWLEIKPILRPLSDMTEEIDKEFDYIGFRKDISIYEARANQIKYLLDLKFDLFGLIEAGLAIDKTKANETTTNPGTNN